MKNNFSEALKYSSLFVAFGLMISLSLFFLFFGKGLQFVLPFILIPLFFVIFLVSEKLPFVNKHPAVKIIIGLIAVLLVAVLI